MTIAISACCNASTRLGGGIGDFSDADRVVTQHYICEACEQACDLAGWNKPTESGRDIDVPTKAEDPLDKGFQEVFGKFQRVDEPNYSKNSNSSEPNELSGNAGRLEEKQTLDEILISCYHAGGLAERGRTIHSGTVQEWEQAITKAIEEILEPIVGKRCTDYHKDCAACQTYARLDAFLGKEKS